MTVFSLVLSASEWLVNGDICCGITRPSARECARVFLQAKSSVE